jgi:hypothetical protein
MLLRLLQIAAARASKRRSQHTNIKSGKQPLHKDTKTETKSQKCGQHNWKLQLIQAT